MKGPETNTAGILASLALCTLLPSLSTSIANVALPELARVFSATFSQVQWVVVAYLLATTAVIVGAGWLGDLVGRRRLLLAGITLFTVASMLCGAASGLVWLVAARALQGIGAAIMLALTLALAAGSFPKGRTGRAMGLLGMMSAAGTALGPSLGGLLIAAFGWQAIFLINLPLGLIAMGLARRYLPADGSAPVAITARFDIAGILLLAPTLGAALLTSALVATVMMATLVVGPFHLSGVLGLSVVHVGLVMSVGPITAALISLPAGRIVDRLGARRTTAGGLAGMLLGCTALGLAPLAAGISGYLLPIVLLTGSYALFQTANNTAVMQDVPADERGVVAGLLNLSRNLGLISGAAVLGTVHARASHVDGAFAMRVTFAAAAVLMAMSLALSRRGAAPPPASPIHTGQAGEP